jgi:uncharacterized protein
MTPRQTIQACLQNCHTIAVVGLSPKTHRDSFKVAQYMQAQGYRIIPINPNASEILGERVHASLLDAAQHEHIDLVNCFRNAQDIAPIAQEAIAIGAKALWMQLGIANEAAAKSAQDAGLWVVQDRCLKIEHALQRPSAKA